MPTVQWQVASSLLWGWRWGGVKESVEGTKRLPVLQEWGTPLTRADRGPCSGWSAPEKHGEERMERNMASSTGGEEARENTWPLLSWLFKGSMHAVPLQKIQWISLFTPICPYPCSVGHFEASVSSWPAGCRLELLVCSIQMLSPNLAVPRSHSQSTGQGIAEQCCPAQTSDCKTCQWCVFNNTRIGIAVMICIWED